MDAKIEFRLCLIPFCISYFFAVIINSVAIESGIFKKVPVELKLRMVFAQIGKEALMVCNFNVFKLKKGLCQNVQCFVIASVNGHPSGVFFVYRASDKVR